MIELRELSKSYGGRQVLAIERLSLPPGELTLIVGANGAGKSTLLKIVALVERPDRGTISIGDVTVSRFNRHRLRRRIGWLMQSPLMLKGSALENVEVGLLFRRTPAPVRRQRALKALERVGFGADPQKPAALLSGGEQKLVALARLLVLEPEILLLDEPTVYLDEARRRRLNQILWEEVIRGSVVVVAEHQKDPAFEGARWIGLEGGRVVPNDQLEELGDQPLDRP